MNLCDLLWRSARSHGERPALYRGESLIADYADLAREAASIGAALRSWLALQDGDRVAVIMSNCPEYVTALFGIWAAGLIAVPINAKLHPHEIEYILEDSGASLCVVSPDLTGNVADCPSVRMGKISAIETGSSEWRRLTTGAGEEGRDPHELAWLFYTSGTTGRPKGAALSHANLHAMIHSFFSSVDAPLTTDKILHAAPMSHGSGLYLLPYVQAAAASVLPEGHSFDTAEIGRLLRAHEGIGFFAAPTMLHRLLNDPALNESDWRGVRTIIYGGGPMYLKDSLRAVERLPNRLVQIYGQGESPMTGTVLSRFHHHDTTHPRYLRRLESIGIPQSMVEVRVVDAEGAALRCEEVGELQIKSPSTMTGYWCNPEATRAALQDGWLKTGDLGCIDRDGFVTLKGRSKDLIISGGSNVYAKEVEDALLCHPGVSEAAVVGIPDEKWGERIVAFIVRAHSKSTPSEADLDALCLSRLARFKRPKGYRFVQALPKNSYGKVLKRVLREQSWIRAADLL